MSGQFLEGHRVTPAPPGIASWDIDPYAPEVLRNLEDYYVDLRSRGDFVYLSRYGVLACGRYAPTREVFSDWRRFVSSRGVGLTDFKLVEPWRAPSLLLEVDPPYHSKTRRVIANILSPRAIDHLKERFLEAAERLIDALVARPAFDAVTDLAKTFPVTVFPEAVGLRRIDPERLLEYGAMGFNALGPDNALRRQSLGRAPDVVPYITEQCARHALHPDGLGADIFRAVDRGEIDEHEGQMLVRSFLTAGLDTTVTGLGNLVWVLARYPQVLAQVRADEKLIPQVFDEVVRLTSPVHSFCRTAALDSEVCGVAIAADTKILCVLGAANLDQDHWDQAAEFNFGRKGHLGFGVGIHSCVGQALAKAEAAAVMTALARRVRRVELLGEAEWDVNHAIHALKLLPVRFVA